RGEELYPHRLPQAKGALMSFDIPSGTVFVMLKGDAARLDEAIAALAEAGISGGLSDRGADLVEAYFHDGSDRPSSEFGDQCTARAQQAVAHLGFTSQGFGTQVNDASTIRPVFDRRTGKHVDSVHDRHPLLPVAQQLLDISERHNVPLEELDVRDNQAFDIPTE
ncbi:hypothetical protein ACFU5Q_21015, partial [Bacillus velezensis]